MNAQFEQLSILETSSEFEYIRFEDTAASYVKLMLCGDIMHKQNLLNQYASKEESLSYRSWFRQIKPLLYSADFSIANLRTFFPGKDLEKQFPNSSPDLFLGEIQYSGFNLLMMANQDDLTDRTKINNKSLYKIDALDIYHCGYYEDSNDYKANFPLVLEKNDIRIGFLNYSCDTILNILPKNTISLFDIHKAARQIRKAKDTMLCDYLIIYIDWAHQDSNKLMYVAEMLNEGADIIIGTGDGESFTNADLLTFSDNSLKLHVDNIGHLNAIQNGRESNKSAIIEVVLKRSKKTRKTELYDIGFIPTWTLIDDARYAVVPISNLEEKHIKNIGLNYVQYSDMKIALTDLRYDFFNKIPELHYDYNDRHVNDVEQTTYIRNTLMFKQQKVNNQVKEAANNSYASLFGSPPPVPQKNEVIPYEDNWDMYRKHRKVTANKFEPRDTTEIYGSYDEVSDKGVLSIKSNHKSYQRVKIPPLSAEEKARRDSIKKYNDRFVVYDSVAEMRKMIKQARKDSLKRRDSIFKASLDPNYESKSFEVLETSRPYNAYNQQIKEGVYTTVDKANSGTQVINEYFMVQVFELPNFKKLDLITYPSLKGYEVRFENNYYRYLVGRTNSSKLAIEMAKNIRQNGIPDAIVVRYRDGVHSVYKSHF